MTMTQRYAGFIRRNAAIEFQSPTSAEALRQAARHMEDLQASYDAMRNGWQPMGLAPEDGTAILALLNNSDVPHPVRYVDDGWEMVWDKYRLSNADGPRYWMAIPDDPDA